MSGLQPTVFAGRYRVVRRLGAGGSAAVFLARDERLRREVAIKRLHGAEVTTETAQRLRREARIMASLRHPNLVAVFDMLMEGDDLLLVMEYVRGQTLAEVLASGPLDWERTADLLDPVAEALDHVHEAGVVHRDLKPSNILVGSSGIVKVADLGLATAAEITNITPPGTVVGTPAYMAPEQARGNPCTRAVDVYSLATIAFQALSGTLPRAGTTVVAVIAQATREPPPDLRARRPGTPAAAAAALMRGMSPRPEDRQPSASALLGELDAAFRAAARRAPPPPEPAPARPPPAPPLRERRARAPTRNRRGRVLALGALAAGVAAVLVLVFALAGERGSPPAAPRADRAPASTSTDSRTPSPAPAGTASPVPAGTATSRAAARRLSAAATVRAFYRHAAAGEYRAAWKLAGPGMRAAFGDSFDQFRAGVASLRRIRFERVAVTHRDAASATVEIRTVARHVDRVDRCSGTLRTVRGDGGRWVVEPAGVHCTSG